MTRVIHSLWPWTPDSGCAATSEPDVVTGLTATASGSTTINLIWDADSTASPNEPSEYDIERSNDGSTGWSVIATISAPAVSYSDTSLSAGQTRHYRIVAKNCFDVANASTSDSATTAAGSIAPAWDIDFSTGSTYADLVLTRASTGTYVDSSGYIASASTNAARLTHNSSGSRLGLLVEEARVQRNHSTENFAAGSWFTTTTNISNTTATNDPSNAQTADKIAATTANGVHWNRQPVSSIGSTTKATLSCYVKAGGGVGASYAWIGAEAGGAGKVCRASFDLTNGSRTDLWDDGVGNLSAPSNAEDVGNGWYRLSLTVDGPTRVYVGLQSAATAAVFAPTFAGAAADADFIYAWGYQTEIGAGATSYIPNTATSGTVTRSADLAHVLESSITSWGDPGALVVHFYPPQQAGTILSTDDASTAQVGIEASTTTAARAFWSSGSTATETLTTGVQKAVHYWNGSTSKFCINGGTVQSGTNNLTIGNTDFVTLGAEATDSGGAPSVFSQYANCVIRKVEFYSGTLTDANLQTITT